jgi:hypothetical protein
MEEPSHEGCLEFFGFLAVLVMTVIVLVVLL